MAGCIAANDGGWFLRMRGVSDLEGFECQGGNMVRCISLLIFTCMGTFSRFMRGRSWIYVYQCMLELAA